MFIFLLGVAGGLALGGGYVLLNTPRSGHDNKRVIQDLYYTTKYNVEDVQEKSTNFQEAMNHFKAELKFVQNEFVPEVMSHVNELTEDVHVHMRRINDSVNEMITDVEGMNQQIDIRNSMDKKY